MGEGGGGVLRFGLGPESDGIEGKAAGGACEAPAQEQTRPTIAKPARPTVSTAATAAHPLLATDLKIDS